MFVVVDLPSVLVEPETCRLEASMGGVNMMVFDSGLQDWGDMNDLD